MSHSGEIASLQKQVNQLRRALVFLGALGIAGFAMANKRGQSSLLIEDQFGKARAELSILSSGKVALMLYDLQGKTAARLSVTDEGNAELVLRHNDGPATSIGTSFSQIKVDSVTAGLLETSLAKFNKLESKSLLADSARFGESVVVGPEDGPKIAMKANPPIFGMSSERHTISLVNRPELAGLVVMKDDLPAIMAVSSDKFDELSGSTILVSSGSKREALIHAPWDDSAGEPAWFGFGVDGTVSRFESTDGATRLSKRKAKPKRVEPKKPEPKKSDGERKARQPFERTRRHLKLMGELLDNLSQED